jgi:hypothetical protein
LFVKHEIAGHFARELVNGSASLRQNCKIVLSATRHKFVKNTQHALWIKKKQKKKNSFYFLTANKYNFNF